MERCQLCCRDLPGTGPVIRVWRAHSPEYLNALEVPNLDPARNRDHADFKPYEYRLWTVCEDCLDGPMAIYVRAATKLDVFTSLFGDEQNPDAIRAIEELRVWLRLRLPDEGREFSCDRCKRTVIIHNADDRAASQKVYCGDACARARSVPEQSCQHCGERYTPARRNRSRFCCNACKQANYRLRKSKQLVKMPISMKERANRQDSVTDPAFNSPIVKAYK